MLFVKLFIAPAIIGAVALAYEPGPCEGDISAPNCLTSEPCGFNQCSPTAGSCKDGQCLDVMGDPTYCQAANNVCGETFCPDVTAGGTCQCSENKKCLQLELPCPSQKWEGLACVGGAAGGNAGDGAGESGASDGGAGESGTSDGGTGESGTSDSSASGTSAYEPGPCEGDISAPNCLTSEPCGNSNQCSPTTGSCKDGKCLDVMGDPTYCQAANNVCGETFCPDVTAGGTCSCSQNKCLQLELPCPSKNWNKNLACVGGTSGARAVSVAGLVYVIGGLAAARHFG